MAQNSNIGEKKLLLELSQGSELAFTTIYNQYKNSVYSTALRITKSKILSEEAVQDIFLKIWQNKENLIAIDNFENYIYIISRNHLFNSIKKTLTTLGLFAVIFSFVGGSTQTKKRTSI